MTSYMFHGGATRHRSGWKRHVAVVLSAAAFVAAFAPLNQAWCAPVSVALLLWALDGTTVRCAIWLGALQALIGFGVLVSWVTAVAWVAWPALIAVMVLWRVGLAVILRTCLKRRLPIVTVSCAWVVIEWLQCHIPWGGFPWGRVAYIGGLGWLTRSSVWFSAVGLTFVIVAIGTALWLVLQRVQGALRVLVACLVVMFVAAGTAGIAAPAPQSQGNLRVGLVQGGVPREGFGTVDQERAVFANHVAQTKVLLQRHADLDLIVWPENSLGDAVVADAQRMTELRSMVEQARVPLLSGTVLMDSGNPSQLRNRAMLWDSQGRVTQTYDKQHLVPFGEFVPFRSLARKVTSQVDLIGRDFAPGDSPGLITVQPGVTAGILICFEVGYEDLARALANASFLVNQTNNATYMDSAQPEQQFRMSQVRAAESGRTTIVAATSGVSAAIDGYGQVVRGTRTDGNVARATVVSVPLVTGRTPAAVVGPVLTYASFGLLALLWTPWWPTTRCRRKTMQL